MNSTIYIRSPITSGNLLLSGLRLALALIALPLFSPSTASAGWQTFSTRDGLMSNWIYSLLEDRAGNLWFGHEGFVSRYDGVSWTYYTETGGPGGNDAGEISAMLEDRAGNIWFGTDVGVSCYDGATWRTYTTADGLVNNGVLAIVEDRAGVLWFGTVVGVSRYDGATWRTYTTADGLADNEVRAILEDRAGNIWFGTRGGVSRYDRVRWQTYTTADGLADNYVLAMLEDRAGNIWFGGRGVTRYDGASWRTYTTADGLVASNASSIVEDRAGNLWIASFAGVSHYDGVRWLGYTTTDGLVNNSASVALADRAGNVWFGTYSYGVSRYDGVRWRTYTTADGLANNYVHAMLEDVSGNLWFGTSGYGVSRYDGVNWRTYTNADGLVSNVVYAMLEDASGSLWFGTLGGVSRYDGVSWRTYRIGDGLVNNHVHAMLEDRSGSLWFGTPGYGVSRFNGVSWRTYTTADGLANNSVYAMLEDGSGDLWFATQGGVSRYDGMNWRTYTTADGLPDNFVIAMLEDRSGDLWFATYGGLSRYDGTGWRTYGFNGLGGYYVEEMLEDRSGNLWFGTRGYGLGRFDGENWLTYTTADGLVEGSIRAMLEDRAGNLWLGTDGSGVGIHSPDRVAPHAVLLVRPPRVSPARAISFGVVAAFGEAGIEFSYAFDGDSWSPWSAINSGTSGNLTDGMHRLTVRARDRSNNVDLYPTEFSFEVDATPPPAVITVPSFGQPVRGTTTILGTADDPRFKDYRVEFRPAGAPAWTSPPLAQSSSPVPGGPLADWNTLSVSDGAYDLRLSVTDSLGLVGTTVVSVFVDNQAPFFDETAPTKVPAATGGDVYTTNAETHLYFPPHAFAQDAVVMVTAAPAGSAPPSLASGGAKALDGYEVGWAGTLKKPARFTLSYAGASIPAGTLALYRSSDGTNWERLGGTVDAKAQSISLAVSAPGRYALYADNGLGSGSATLSAIAFTPRVFSPSGGFADTQVGISFTLGKPAPVTVRVFSRSGRLVREVVTGQQLAAGANLIPWDGRDRNGGFVVDGVYLVTVEALGNTETKTLAVVK